MSAAAKKIHEGFEAILSGDAGEAERLFTEVTKSAPDEADGWNGMGAVHFERAELVQSLKCYEKALRLAKLHYGGRVPKNVSWDDEGKPLLRAIHGMAMNHYRMGELQDAEEGFETLLQLNPDDNQAAGIMLEDVRKKKKLWKK